MRSTPRGGRSDGRVSRVLDLAATTMLGAMVAVAVYNLRTARRLTGGAAPAATPLVSLLVPARNEAHNLANVLPHVAALRYPRLEVLVLDDDSSDGTARVVREHAARDVRLRLVQGSAPPSGWLGKCWACACLAAEARGEVLVFADADVTPAPDAIVGTVALMEETGADVLTAIPRQRFGGWVERAVVPLVVQLPLLALLPLRLVADTRSPRVSMANGQWLAFRRTAYQRCGGHAGVRGSVVEDVALGRAAKRAGLRLLPVLAPELLEVRMYRGAQEVADGFGKNLYPLVGGTPAALAAAATVVGLTGVYPWAALLGGRRQAALPAALLLAVRCVGVAVFRHGWRSVLLHPAGVALTIGIAVRSAMTHRRGAARWKGRPLRATGTPARRGGTVPTIAVTARTA